MFFPIDTNLVYVTFEWYLLRVKVFLVMARNAENIEKKPKKTDRRKTLKNEEKKSRRIRVKSYNNNIHILFENIV